MGTLQQLDITLVAQQAPLPPVTLAQSTASGMSRLQIIQTTSVPGRLPKTFQPVSACCPAITSARPEFLFGVG